MMDEAALELLEQVTDFKRFDPTGINIIPPRGPEPPSAAIPPEPETPPAAPTTPTTPTVPPAPEAPPAAGLLAADRREGAAQMTRSDYVKENLIGLGRQRSSNAKLLEFEHGDAVRDALSREEKLPDEVMKDYPQYEGLEPEEVYRYYRGEGVGAGYYQQIGEYVYFEHNGDI